MTSTTSLFRDISEFLRHAGLDSLSDASVATLLSEAAALPPVSQHQLAKAVRQLSLSASRPQLLHKKLEDLRKKSSGSHLERFIVVLARHTAATAPAAPAAASNSSVTSVSGSAGGGGEGWAAAGVGGAGQRSRVSLSQSLTGSLVADVTPGHQLNQSSLASTTTAAAAAAAADRLSNTSRITQELKLALSEAACVPARSLRDQLLAAQQLDETAVPPVPDWLTFVHPCDVTSATATATASSSGGGSRLIRNCNAVPLGSMPWPSQERCVIDNLLSCLLANSGHYLTITRTGLDIDQSMHPSLKEVVHQVSSLVLAYVSVAEFVDESAFLPSQVLQALGAAMRNIQREHEVLVAQLETQFLRHSLSVHSLWLYLQPSLKTMQLLANVIEQIRSHGLSSGQILSLLHRGRVSGDGHCDRLYALLLEQAARPYLRTLHTWLTQGVVRDPYLEFMVKDIGVRRRRRASQCGGGSGASSHVTWPDSVAEDGVGGGGGGGGEAVRLSVAATSDADQDAAAGFINYFWQKRYSLLELKTPVFLQPLADTILRAGKYLNVLKQCNGTSVAYNGRIGDDGSVCGGGGGGGDGDSDAGVAAGGALAVADKSYQQLVQRCFEHSSRRLLHQLLNRADLVGRLRSMKHYYMLDRGDFVLQLIALCESELTKAIDDIVPARLQNLLELALRTSSANTDPYKDELQPDLQGYDLKYLMTRIHSIETCKEQKWLPSERLTINGFEAFTFSTSVAWPASLVIDRKSIAFYQMIFRQLFQCKLLETQLCRLWATSACVPATLSVPLQCRMRANTLCQRMLTTMQKLLYYMSSEVLEPSWCSFLHSVAKVTTFDDVLLLHATMLDECMRDCMLKHLPLLTALSDLLAVCRQFIQFVIGGCVVDGLVTCELVAGRLALLDARFCDALLDLMEKVGDHHRRHFADRLIGLLSRLDYNGYYSHLMENRARKRTAGVES